MTTPLTPKRCYTPVEKLQIRGVCWAFNIPDLGIQPGAFMKYLIQAACYADAENLRKICNQYPAVKDAILTLRNSPNGEQQIKEMLND